MKKSFRGVKKRFWNKESLCCTYRSEKMLLLISYSFCGFWLIFLLLKIMEKFPNWKKVSQVYRNATNVRTLCWPLISKKMLVSNTFWFLRFLISSSPFEDNEKVFRIVGNYEVVLTCELSSIWENFSLSLFLEYKSRYTNFNNLNKKLIL